MTASSSRRTRTTVRVAVATVTLCLGLGLSTTAAQAGVGPSNNFGSDNTYGDTGFSAIMLNDGPISEWAIWWNYVPGWSTTQRNNYAAMAGSGFEYYESLQVTVTKGADGSDQDVRLVPTTSYSSFDSNLIAVTTCIIPGATIYGSHHHRVCDRKQITTYQHFNTITDLGTAVFDVLAHEFGHNLGLRHSNAPCNNPAGQYATDAGIGCRGVSAAGTPQANTHNAPGTDSLMYVPAGPGPNAINLQDAGNINDHY